MEDKELINTWVWDEYYEMYFWRPIYCTPPESLEVDKFGQLIEKKKDADTVVRNQNTKIQL